jgi:hypothetical protein
MPKFKIPKKYQKYIAEDSIDVYHDLDSSTYFVWLRYGYCYDFENSGSHTQGYDSFNEALAGLESVYLCNCDDCATEPLGTPVADLNSMKKVTLNA